MVSGNGSVNEDLQKYPILTEEVDLPTPRSGGAGEAAPGEFGRVVERALSDVLGWRPNTRDPKSFVAALNASFTREEREGHTEWHWTPRSFTVATEMGAVTGAQASILARAQAAAEKALPLLEGLAPLRADADDEDSEASAAVIRSDIQELVRELGQVGGPVVQRVDELFRSLLGLGPDDQPLFDPEAVGGQLGILRDRLGLDRSRVNTIDEEQNLTNYLILVDYVFSLRQSWLANRASFDRKGNDAFLGTHLVLLSRALSVVSESVRETEFVMNSVFLGPAERQTTQLLLQEVDAQEPIPVTIAELLSWVDLVASEEGPRLIREGGKDGVIALTPTLARLEKLVGAAADLSEGGATNLLTPGFHTPRVQRALQELEEGVAQAHELASQIRRLPGPNVALLQPPTVEAGDPLTLLIFGSDFQDTPKVGLLPNDADPTVCEMPTEPERVASNVAFAGPGILVAAFSSPPEGTWTVVVENPDGGCGRGGTLQVLDGGVRARTAQDVRSSPKVSAARASSPAPTSSGVAPSPVATARGVSPRTAARAAPTSRTKRDAAKESDLRVTQLEPPTALPGEKKKLVRVQGAGFQKGVVLEFEQSDAIRARVESVDPTTLVVRLDLDQSAIPGPHTVIAKNPDGKTFVADQVFRVDPPPET
jgi:hypothetical protein